MSDVYMYSAALFCGSCIVPRLIADKVLSPAAADMDVETALEQHREANGWTSESDYDSDEFAKGPFADGGGEADSVQTCDACDELLGNELTTEGVESLREMAEETLARPAAHINFKFWREIMADSTYRDAIAERTLADMVESHLANVKPAVRSEAV